MEYIRNIEGRVGGWGAHWGGGAGGGRRWVCVPPSQPPLYIPYIFHVYFLNIFHMFSLVCFLFTESGVGPDMTEVRVI